MTPKPPSCFASEIAPQRPLGGRGAAILGTRSLVAAATFDALLSLLVDAGVIQKDRARGLLTAVADELDGTAEHPEWAVEPGEMRLQAHRLRMRAEMLA